MKITVIHPSRGRHGQAQITMDKWISRAHDKSNIEYIISVDDDDPMIAYYARLADENPDVILLINPNKSCMQAVNAAAKEATGDILIVSSDDFDCPPNWDQLLTDFIGDRKDWLLKTQDRQQPWIITMPCMDREYYNRFGYIYNPGYDHMFADTELTHAGHVLGKVIECDIEFRHLHYTTGLTPRDQLNVRNDSTWSQGEQFYLQRVRENFGLPEPSHEVYIHPSHREWWAKKGVKL